MAFKIKLRYLERSLYDVGKALEIPPNQSMLNLGKMYDSFSQQKNRETRLANIESSLDYMINAYAKSASEMRLERQIIDLENKLAHERGLRERRREHLNFLKNKVAEKKEEYTEKYRIIQSAPNRGRFSTEQIQEAINAIAGVE